MFKIFSIISAFMLTTIVYAQTSNYEFKKEKKMSNKSILLEANKAVLKGDYETYLKYCTEDTKWVFVGEQTLLGKEKVREYMKEFYIEPPVFNVELIMEEGDLVTVTGEISLKNKSGAYQHYMYCDVWRFRDGKMAGVMAYVIEKNSK